MSTLAVDRNGSLHGEKLPLLQRPHAWRYHSPRKRATALDDQCQRRMSGLFGVVSSMSATRPVSRNIRVGVMAEQFGCDARGQVPVPSSRLPTPPNDASAVPLRNQATGTRNALADAWMSGT